MSILILNEPSYPSEVYELFQSRASTAAQVIGTMEEAAVCFANPIASSSYVAPQSVPFETRGLQ